MPRARRPAGRLLAGDKAIVIFRSNQVVTNVTVLETAFRIETADLGTLTLKLPQIQSIVYKNLPTYPTDVLRTVGATELSGNILNDPVRLSADDLGGSVRIPKADLLSIVF